MTRSQHPSVPAFYSFQPEGPKTGQLVRSESKITNMVKTHKIVITRDIGEKAMAILEQERSDLNVHLQIWCEPGPADRKWLLHNVEGATGILVMLSEKVDDEFLDAAGPSLKVVSTMSVGYDHIDVHAVAKRGIQLGFTPDVLTESVADISIMLALMASRNGGFAIKVVQSGQWPAYPWAPFSFCGPQLSCVTPSSPSKVAGFLGYGRIAQATVRRLAAFGVTNIIYADSTSLSLHMEPSAEKPYLDHSPAKVTVATLAVYSDFLFVLAPHTPSTHHIISAKFLNLMKPTAILVNTARGPLVDSDALACALREGKIFAAGLDVVEGEPHISKDHPLLQEPNCVVLPHVASATFETREEMACLAARNLLKGILGEPLEVGVDLQKF